MSISRQGGISLIELVVSMVVLSVGVVAVLSTFGVSVRGSVEPMVRKQMTAIAESLLGEILHQPFTYCDPDDAAASTATSAAACASSQETLGPTAGESRTGTPQYDNVGDYHTFSMTPVVDITGANAMAGYTAAVAIVPAGGTFGLPANDALQVTVTVTRGGESYALTGYRFRYAPRY